MGEDIEILIDHMFSELDRQNPEYTEWEEGFLESIWKRWEKYRNLSDKQKEILERIYTKKTS